MPVYAGRACACTRACDESACVRACKRSLTPPTLLLPKIAPDKPPTMSSGRPTQSLCSSVLCSRLNHVSQTERDSHFLVQLFFFLSSHRCTYSKLMDARLDNRLTIASYDTTIMRPGAGTGCWLEHRTRDRKVASSNPAPQEGWEKFLLQSY